MHTFRRAAVLLTCCVLATTLASAQSLAPVVPVPTLDVARYMGVWYEVAKFPNRFQSKCVADTSANYTLQPDGGVQVLNACRLGNGDMQRAVGDARQLGGATSARLKVRFAPAWLSWLPWVWGDYWVVDLDDGYELAAVSEPRREFLWILSRSPEVPAERYAALLVRLSRMGLDVGRLEKTSHRRP